MTLLAGPPPLPRDGAKRHPRKLSKVSAVTRHDLLSPETPKFARPTQRVFEPALNDQGRPGNPSAGRDFKPFAATVGLTAKAACDYTKRPEVKPAPRALFATTAWVPLV